MKKFLTLALCLLVGTFVFANGSSYDTELNMVQNSDGTYLSWQTVDFDGHTEIVLNYFVVDPMPYDEADCRNCIREFMSEKYWSKAIRTKELNWSIRYNRPKMNQTFAFLPADVTVSNYCIRYRIEG